MPDRKTKRRAVYKGVSETGTSSGGVETEGTAKYKTVYTPKKVKTKILKKTLTPDGLKKSYKSVRVGERIKPGSVRTNLIKKKETRYDESGRKRQVKKSRQEALKKAYGVK